MLKEQQQKPKTGVLRVKLTARVTFVAYDAIREIQQKYIEIQQKYFHV